MCPRHPVPCMCRDISHPQLQDVFGNMRDIPTKASFFRVLRWQVSGMFGRTNYSASSVLFFSIYILALLNAGHMPKGGNRLLKGIHLPDALQYERNI